VKVVIDFSGLQGAADFYFLRHGRSEGNEQGIAQGRRDTPLAAEGRAQVLDAAPWFEGKEIGLILSSPLQRALQTARIIGTHIEAPVEADETLTDLDVGLFEGLTFQEMERRHPEAWREFQALSWEGVPRAESVTNLLERGRACWARLIDLAAAGNRAVLVVTHAAVLQWVVKTTLGHQSWMPLFPVSNCGVYHFHVNNRTIPPAYPAYYTAWRLINAQPAPA
jgi:broad specificity phosphatase PhoE